MEEQMYGKSSKTVNIHLFPKFDAWCFFAKSGIVIWFWYIKT